MLLPSIQFGWLRTDLGVLEQSLYAELPHSLDGVRERWSGPFYIVGQDLRRGKRNLETTCLSISTLAPTASLHKVASETPFEVNVGLFDSCDSAEVVGNKCLLLDSGLLLLRREDWRVGIGGGFLRLFKVGDE